MDPLKSVLETAQNLVDALYQLSSSPSTEMLEVTQSALTDFKADMQAAQNEWPRLWPLLPPDAGPAMFKTNMQTLVSLELWLASLNDARLHLPGIRAGLRDNATFWEDFIADSAAAL